MSTDWRHYLGFAADTAWHAGQLALGYFQTGLRPDFKDDESPVTVADRKAEQVIRQRIEDAFPDHAILGEEYGDSSPSGASHRWIVDPIDGTISFVRGVPLFAVLLALEVEGDVKVGVAYYPALDELLAAAEGQGCWWNGRPASVSSVSNLSEALISFTDPVAFAPYGRDAAWQRIRECGATVRGWSDAYGHLLVATGRADVMLDPIMNPWDCGPFLPILREAGGYFGDWQGNPTIHGAEGLSTNGHLLDDMLALIDDTHDP